MRWKFKERVGQGPLGGTASTPRIDLASTRENIKKLMDTAGEEEEEDDEISVHVRMFNKPIGDDW